MNPRYVRAVLTAIAVLPFTSQASAADMGTAFTYQGSLEKSARTPPTATCDFRFGLWDDSVAGNQKGTSPQTVTGVRVTHGVFTATMDFGGSGIDGTARWLAIEVRCPTGVGGFHSVTPRVALAPVPHALALPGFHTQQTVVGGSPGTPNLIGGYSGNSVGPGVSGATISGGGAIGSPNFVNSNYATVGGGIYNIIEGGSSTNFPDTADYATIGGGFQNAALGPVSTIGGGENNVASDYVATIGGGTSNIASFQGSTIGGGASNTASNESSTVGGGEVNTASGPLSTIGGGNYNTASGDFSTVGGGGGTSFESLLGNTASGAGSTVGGGAGNTAGGQASTVGGGISNVASGDFSTVGGGNSNIAGGFASTVPGGDSNAAGGSYSFAAGRRAEANNDGSFVWADSTDADFTSSAVDQFSVRASGGTRIYSNAALTMGVTLAPGTGAWAAVSDRNLKENFHEVDTRDLLARLASIPVTTWNYKSQDGSIRHIGPMGQDFYSAFRVGEEETRITTIDADGVALAAIQGLYEVVQEKDCAIEELKARLAKLESLMETSMTRKGQGQ